MQNPERQIKELTDSLIDRISDLDAKHSNLTELSTLFENPDKLKKVEGYRYLLAVYAELIYKDLIITLSKVYDYNSKKSIHKLIEWIENQPSIFKGREIEIAAEFKEGLSSQKKRITNLMIQRDKFFAHDDTKYFNNVGKLSKEANLKLIDLWGLISFIKDVLWEIVFSRERRVPEFQVEDFISIRKMIDKLST
jgi:hypothetical protein